MQYHLLGAVPEREVMFGEGGLPGVEGGLVAEGPGTVAHGAGDVHRGPVGQVQVRGHNHPIMLILSLQLTYNQGYMI